MNHRHQSWLACGLALCSLACSAQQPEPVVPRAQARPSGVCFMARDSRLAAAPLRPQDWLKLLVKLELGRDAIVALHDCTGRTIREPASSYCRQAAESEAVPLPVPIRQSSVFERSLSAEQSLLWIVSHRLPSGEGFGPLALTRRTPLGIEVEALGNLSMRTERVKLELWRVRNEAVIVASGEVCRVGPAAASGEIKACHRAARLFVQRQGALLEAPLLSYQGRCLQQTPLELDQRQEIPLAGGLRRHFELSSALAHDTRQIKLEEHLVVRDSDPSLPLSAAREVQRIEATRFIRVSGGRLYTQQRPLWSQALPKLMPANNGEPNSAGRAMTSR